jgi:hypothetical protein
MWLRGRALAYHMQGLQTKNKWGEVLKNNIYIGGELLIESRVFKLHDY